jgi:hypothetical protein
MDIQFDRREFIRRSGLAISGILLASNTGTAGPAGNGKLFSAMGMSGPLDRAAQLKALGAAFLTVGTGDFLVPDKPDEVFAKNLAKLSESPLPALACNGFIRPKNLRCVGEEANHDQVLEWAETAFRRLKQAGGKFIVFGSGGARELRNGWPKDKADAQFVALPKRMGPLAEKHGVTVVVEQLLQSECNYINRIGEGAALIRAANHPNIRLLADLYHMRVMISGPSSTSCVNPDTRELSASKARVWKARSARHSGRLPNRPLRLDAASPCLPCRMKRSMHPADEGQIETTP